MIGYKGFDKDWKCRDFQYEEGKEYVHEGDISLCESGFHFCENPLDVLNYYKDPSSKYAIVEADEVSDKKDNDSKRVSKRIKIKARLSFVDLLKSGIKLTFDYAKEKTSGYSAHSATSGNPAHSATSGNYAHSATSGDHAHSATSGYSAHSATSGYSAHSATSGYSAHSATSGSYAHSATSGYSAHSATSGYSAHSATSGNYARSATSGYSAHSATSGNYAHSATSGYSAHSATSGYYAHSATSGKNSIAASIGGRAKAKSSIGNWIVVSEIDENTLEVLCVKTAKIDGKKLKADTYYEVKNGKFIVSKEQ